MKIPVDLKYSKEHEWLRVLDEKTEEGEVIAVIGITDFAQSELGELVYVEVDMLDQEVARDDVFGTVEAVKTTSDLFMPVGGRILEFNPSLDENEGDDPSLINSDPYGEGWIVKIALKDESELDALMNAEGYGELVN